MADPIQVEVTRGGVVEAVHAVHAVAMRDGRIVAEAGDPRLVTFLRSSAKPLQALPLVRARPDLGRSRDRDRMRLAPRPARTARRSADAAREGGRDRGRPRDRGRCRPDRAHLLGQARRIPRRLRGQRFRDARATGSASHPLQQELLAEIAGAADVDPASVAVAIDGCGVPTFALPLDRCAHAFGRLPRLEGGARVIAAMRAHPEMLRGPVAADAMLVRELDGWVAKGGAEGLFCACSDDGLAVALKVEDGVVPGNSPCTCGVFGPARHRDGRPRLRHGGKQPRGDRRRDQRVS